ncbi:MAG: SBBP repeat-containing protein, partial [Blastocatellia bacterium]
MRNSNRISDRSGLFISVLFGLVHVTAFAVACSSAAITPWDGGTSSVNRKDQSSSLFDGLSSKSGGLDRDAQTRLSGTYGRLPISFEVNRGQSDPGVKFLSRVSGACLFLTSTEAVLAIHKTSSNSAAVIGMKLVGASTVAKVEGVDLLPGTSNYLIGKDPDKWQTKIPTYRKVQYRDIYAGVDLIYYGNQQQLEYDFVVSPGSDPRAIRLDFRGARQVRVDAAGDLVLQTKSGKLRMLKPSIHQEIDGDRRVIPGRYVMRGKHRVGFEIAAYDKNKTLIIDPVFDHSTFLGGTSFDEGKSIAVDSGGNAFVTGRTTSFNFPVTIDGFDTTYANSTDVFVTKMNPSGSAILYSTYLGGNDEDMGLGIAIDASGNAYVTGSTSSNDYPMTPGVFQVVRPGGFGPGDPFVTKLNSAGTGLIYSTFLGGTSSDQANSIAVDSSGNAYVAGFTFSSNFPTTPGAFQTVFAGGGFPQGDAFIAKLNNNGTSLIYSTLLGGSASDQATGIAIDSQGNAYVTGSTTSTDFDTTPGSFQTTYGGSNIFSSVGDAFATKLNNTGAALLFSTYLGGEGDDAGMGIALDSSGNSYLAGWTFSINFPTTAGAVRVANGGAAQTTNGGNSWAAINNGLTNSTVLTLAI